MPVNPLLVPSSLPFGYPDFDAIREEHFAPAFAAGMAEQRAEVDAITTSPEPPTFDDTVVALERSGQTLRRVSAVFFTLVGSCSTPGIRAIEADLAPQLAEHADAILLDGALFARLDRLHAARAQLDLDPESLRLLERRHRDAVRAGARLGPAEQRRLRELNAELSTLSTEFGSRLLAEANDSAVHVTNPARLRGLSPDAVSAAARAAAARDLDGYLITLVLPTEQPVLGALTDRELREQVHAASVARGSRGNEHDSRGLVLRITALRAERARLLGHPHHASWVVADGTAGTVEAVDAMLGKLAPIAAANARAEAAELAAEAGHPIEPWDRAFYAERVRRTRFDLDAATLRPYFELDRVLRDGVFHAAGLLYGLRFAERHDLPRHHPDVRIFDVHDDSGRLGLFVADLYARDSKRGGAWMNSLRHPVPPARHPAGGAEHAQYLPSGRRRADPADPRQRAHAVPRVRACAARAALRRAVPHVRRHRCAAGLRRVPLTGQRDVVGRAVGAGPLRPPPRDRRPLPAELVARLAQARQFGQGFATTEYLAAALLDQAWHRLGPDDRVTDVETFEAAALAAAGMTVRSAPPRYRSTYFNHVFGGAYSAGYYSYIWSEVLDADTVEWFAEHGGLLRENGEAFRRGLLSRGGSVDPLEAYRAFRGRDPEIGPLLARRGLAG